MAEKTKSPLSEPLELLQKTRSVKIPKKEIKRSGFANLINSVLKLSGLRELEENINILDSGIGTQGFKKETLCLARETLKSIVRQLVKQVVCGGEIEESEKRYQVVNEEKIEIDDEGYLKDWKEWKPEVAVCMAKGDGLELEEIHWRIILLYKELFEKGGGEMIPKIPKFIKELNKIDNSRKWETRDISEYFPAGLAKQTIRYAGLLKPTCSD